MKQPVKYIIVGGSALLFSNALTHREVAGHRNVSGAGFVHFKTKTDECGNIVIFAITYGESISLNIKSKLEDGLIISRQIFNTY